MAPFITPGVALAASADSGVIRSKTTAKQSGPKTRPILLKAIEPLRCAPGKRLGELLRILRPHVPRQSCFSANSVRGVSLHPAVWFVPNLRICDDSVYSPVP